MKMPNTQTGFTLIEVAIVFVIVAALLSYTFMPITAQKESNNISKAKADLKRFEDALFGFAAAQGRLPCPALPGSGGAESPLNTTTVCTSNHGFIPSKTLGLSGNVNCDGLLLDPWAQAYRYSITGSNFDVGGAPPGNGQQDFVVASNLQFNSIKNLGPDLKVCWNLTEACTAGGTASNILTTTAPVVMYSLGHPRANQSAEERENAGEGGTIASTCGLARYPIPNDKFFYKAKRREIDGNEFDDIMIFMSEHNLYSVMLKSGILP